MKIIVQVSRLNTLAKKFQWQTTVLRSVIFGG